MYNTILRLYSRIGNEAVVTNAFAKGWITEDEKKMILNVKNKN